MAGLEDLFGRFKDLRSKVEKAGFGKAPPIADVETEAAALRGFLGTTDYASRLEEQEKLAKLQMYLAMAQRGFGAMGEAPRPGESSLGTFGRTLAAPLLGDVSKIAGQIAPLRIAARAAEAKEARDIKLAAYTQAATRAKDLDATALGLLKAYSSTLGKDVKSQVFKNIRAIVEVGGKDETITTPVLVLRNNGGTRTITVGENKVDGQTIPSGALVKSWKQVSDKEPTTKHGLIGQLYANGKFTPVSNIMRATSFEGGKLKTDYYQNRPGPGWTLLRKGEFSEILPSHGPFEAGKTFYVSLSGEKGGKVAAALGDPSATANARIESYISRVKPAVRDAKLPGLKDRIQYRYKNRNVTAELNDLIGTDAFQSVPLDKRDLELAGQTVITRQPFVNTSSKPLTFTFEGEKRTVPVGARIYLSQNELGQLPHEIQAGLGEEPPVSTQLTRYTFKKARTLEGQPGQPGDQWLPGMEISLTPQAYNALPESVKGDLTTDTGETAVIRKRSHIGSLVKLIKEREPDLATAQFGRDETDAVLALYPGSARGASAANALYETIVSIMRQSSTFQGRASNAAISSANKKATTYGASIKEELKGAKEIYEGFQRMDALPRTAFDQLPFSDQMAFARIPRRDLNLRNVNAKWQAAKTALETTKAKVKVPTNEDVAMFANKVRLRTILQDMLENYDLSNTGVLIGPIQKLRGALSDWPLVGSDEAGKFASTLSQLGANLRALQAGEGKDARPSNYRISLISELLPKWRKAEDINTRNVKQAVAVLDTNIKSYFSDAVSSGTVVPQSFSRMAAEAGLKDLSVDPGKYWWLDPEVSATEKLPFTMEASRRSIGEVPWTLRSFEEMKPGVRLPLGAVPPSRTGGKQTYWAKAEDRKDAEGETVLMVIQTDRQGLPLEDASPVPFKMRQKKEQ